MRVAVRDARVVGPTNDFGEITVVPGRPAQTVTSRRGGVVYSGYDHPNTSRIQARRCAARAGHAGRERG
ncbi:hypothetical protein GCM10025868_04960 [Angustibacter aerolatus]|uniref:Uncharacterized protein n=1 Tax=Angustibacter aerolatus TaxID=1162965 RepID=A0ABQ6JCB6_9ACTN|nr:hypothetical protein GCM10025868_04960 [Angustibacter aerolatus]